MHFGAGPWFTVQTPGGWMPVDTITVSNGLRTRPGVRAEYRIDWEEKP